MGGGADDPSYSSFGSRWGIKGSSEVSEGLTAVYKFETRIGQGGTASQGTNQLYTGLSGGFGSLTLGKQSGAAYNHSGAIRDISNWHSHGDVGSRISNALSYSFSADAFSMQVAAIMDGATDTDGAVDQVEFGMTVGLGDIGKVAIGYEKVEDSMMDGTAVMGAMQSGVDGKQVNLHAKNGIENLADVVWRMSDGDKAIVKGKVSGVTYMIDETPDETVTTSPVKVQAVKITYTTDSELTDGSVEMGNDGNYYAATCNAAGREENGACTGDAVKTAYVWVRTTYADPEEGKSGKAMYEVLNAGADNANLSVSATVTPTDTTYGHKASHISASFGLAGITVALGHTTKDSNNPMMNDKEKTNFLGASGSIGDTGLSWNAWGRNVKNNGHKSGDDRSPWTVGLAKSLGGGATTFIEHTNADDGEDGTTSVALRVDF